MGVCGMFRFACNTNTARAGPRPRPFRNAGGKGGLLKAGEGSLFNSSLHRVGWRKKSVGCFHMSTHQLEGCGWPPPQKKTTASSHDDEQPLPYIHVFAFRAHE